jgi:nitrogen fixation/metabolism regulation signal transduction histidine kinase
LNFNLTGLGNSFADLSHELNNVLQKFKLIRNEKEETLLYLQTAMHHVGVALISFDSKGNVDLINKAAKKMFGLNSIKNIQLLNSLSDDFGSFIFKLVPGKKAVHKISNGDETVNLLLHATEFKMRNQIFKLVTFQNIQPELEEKEIEAYSKLIRVLTHEIMNSVTPITSLASTVNQLLITNDHSENLTKETLDDISLAVNTIQRRSEGLVNFIDKYRSLTSVPKPNFQMFRAVQIFERIQILAGSGLKNSGINFHYEVIPENLEIIADPALIEQVLLNLVNNSIQSCAESQRREGKIALKAFIDDNSRAILSVSDNGQGIPADLTDKIFVPFFTTRKDGSGIGLSISRQIIYGHGGNLSVSSKPDDKTVFTIKL